MFFFNSLSSNPWEYIFFFHLYTYCFLGTNDVFPVPSSATAEFLMIFFPNTYNAIYIASRRKLSLRKFSRKISCSLRKYITFKRIKLINIIYGNILLFWCGGFRECKTAAITKNQFVLFIYCQQLDMNIIHFIKRYLRRC